MKMSNEEKFWQRFGMVVMAYHFYIRSPIYSVINTAIASKDHL